MGAGIGDRETCPPSSDNGIRSELAEATEDARGSDRWKAASLMPTVLCSLALTFGTLGLPVWERLPLGGRNAELHR
jgi:hypothetical protein